MAVARFVAETEAGPPVRCCLAPNAPVSQSTVGFDQPTACPPADCCWYSVRRIIHRMIRERTAVEEEPCARVPPPDTHCSREAQKRRSTRYPAAACGAHLPDALNVMLTRASCFLPLVSLAS